MALTVETGAGLAAADAFVSVADCDTYHTGLGNSDWAGSTEAKEGAIRRATALLSSAYRWAGLRSHGRSQALAWPRAGCVDLEGYGIASDAVPREIVSACCEIALREIVTPGAMTPDVVAADAVKREKVGTLEVEYVGTASSATAHRPTILRVDELVAPFLASQASGLFGRVERA